MNKKTCFVLIDLQEKLVPAINLINEVTLNCSTLCKAAHILDIPVIVTEQYPKGLGKTVLKVGKVIEKKDFNCFENQEFFSKLEKYDSVVIMGIESHICVLQTALGALSNGKKVYVVADATSSRKKFDYKIAIKRMTELDIEIVSTEMILFQLMKSSKHPKFKKVQKLIK